MDNVAEIVSLILRDLASKCVVGATGEELDKRAEELIAQYGATSANKGYVHETGPNPYPNVLCVSPNAVVAHGIPGPYKFQEGDIVTLDIGIKKDGLCGDAALTVPIGEIDNGTERLLRYARQAVYEYVDQLAPGKNNRDLAAWMNKRASDWGFTVNRRCGGHTIGTEMHMKPNLYNSVEDGRHTYMDLPDDSFVCIEVVLSKSKDSVGLLLEDGWTIFNSDQRPAAMFEHMVHVTTEGNTILTNHFNREQNFIAL